MSIGYRNDREVLCALLSTNSNHSVLLWKPTKRGSILQPKETLSLSQVPPNPVLRWKLPPLGLHLSETTEGTKFYYGSPYQTDSDEFLMRDH